MSSIIKIFFRVPAYAVAGAVFIGMTFAAGGVSAQGRLMIGAILFVGAVIEVWNGGSAPSGPATLRSLRGKAPLFLPLLACLLAWPGAVIPGLGFEYVALLAFFSLAGAVLSDASRSPLFPASIVAGAVVLSVSVVIESLTNLSMIGIHGLAMGASGLLLGANVSAVALAASLPALWWLRRCHSATLQHANSNAGDVAMLQSDTCVAVVILTGLALTGSRTGIIAAAGGMLIPLSEMSVRSRRRIIFAGLAVVAAGALLYLPRFIDRLDPHYITNSQRISMIRGVIVAFAEKPFLGFGPWSFPVLGQRFLTWPKWELHPHSLPLRIVFESGIVGLGAWVVFAGVLVKCARRSSGRTGSSGGAAPKGGGTQGAGPRGRDLPASRFPLLCALVFGSLTDDVLWIPGLAAIFFLSAGALLDESSVISSTARNVSSDPQKISPFSRNDNTLPLIAALCILFAASCVLPVLYEYRSGLPFEPNSSVIDRAVADRAAPNFMGSRNDPTALRLEGYVLLEKGDTETALSNFRKAFALDPNMIFGPHLLDMAWTFSASSRETEAALALDQAAALAPVLTAWYRGDTVSARPSPIDWHYGIEFPDPSVITASMVPESDDIMDWRHYRGLGAQALLRGDTETARAALRVSLFLAHRQYGTDPVLLRLCAMIDGRALAAEVFERGKPAYPYKIFAPLYYRHPVHSVGDISPWWVDRPRAARIGNRDAGRSRPLAPALWVPPSAAHSLEEPR